MKATRFFSFFGFELNLNSSMVNISSVEVVFLVVVEPVVLRLFSLLFMQLQQQLSALLQMEQIIMGFIPISFFFE